MKNNRGFIYLILLIIVLLVAKYIFFPSVDGIAPTGSSSTKDIPNNVEGFIVHPSVINNRISVTGTVTANEMVELRPEIAGKISYLSISEGKPVQQGQLLVKLVDDDLRAQLKKVVAQAKLANDKLLRQKELLNIQGVSKEEYDAADNEVQSLLADAEILKVQLARTEIRAPFSGVIGLRNVSTGSTINQENVIATIQQINPVKIDFSIPERYSQVLKVNTKIDFLIEGSSNKFTGIIYAIEPQIDTGTRTLKVRARAENSDNKITPGAFARIDILLDQINDALVVPTEAIVPILKGAQVFVSKGGIANAEPVKIGVREEKTVQIVEGISAGDTLITSGIMSIRQGSKLKFLLVK